MHFPSMGNESVASAAPLWTDHLTTLKHYPGYFDNILKHLLCTWLLAQQPDKQTHDTMTQKTVDGFLRHSPDTQHK